MPYLALKATAQSLGRLVLLDEEVRSVQNLFVMARAASGLEI